MVQSIQTDQQHQSASIDKPSSVAVTDAELSAAIKPLVSSDPPLSPGEAIEQIDTILALNETSSPPFLTEKQISALKESKELLANDSFVAQLAGFEQMFSTLSDVKLIKKGDKGGDLHNLKNELNSKEASYAYLKGRAIDLFSTDVITEARNLPPEEQEAFLANYAAGIADLHNDLESVGLSLNGTAIDTFVNSFNSGVLDETSDLSTALSNLQIDGSAEIEAAITELEIKGLDDELMKESTKQAELHQRVTDQYSNDPESLDSAVSQSNDLLANGGLVGLTRADVETMQADVNVSLETRYAQLDLPPNPALWTDSQRLLGENDPTIVYLTMTSLCLDNLLLAAKSDGSVSEVEAFAALQNYAVSSPTTLGNISAKMQFYVGDQHPAYLNVQEQYNAQNARLDSYKGLNTRVLNQIH
jgi:hypothetical protein